jgi:hypothetical protein
MSVAMRKVGRMILESALRNVEKHVGQRQNSIADGSGLRSRERARRVSDEVVG